MTPKRDASVVATPAGYDLWAATYDDFDNPMIAMADWALDACPLEVAGRRVLELGCGTGRNAPSVFDSNARSCLLTALVLEHLRDIDGVIAEAGRVLSPGGTLRVVEIHPCLIDGGTQAHFWADGEEVRLPSFRHDHDEFQRAFRAAGLGIDAVHGWAPPRIPQADGHPVAGECANSYGCLSRL